MKKLIKLALLGTVSLLSLTACQNGENMVVFNNKSKVQESFGGLGVEWGAYEDTEKIMQGGWETIINHMDHLGVARIRLMINYDWFCYDFDDKGNEDKNDDTWSYNFANKYAKNMIEILEYCQIHNIDVAFGAWNAIGSADEEKDEWHMLDEVTSDVRWAKMSADVVNFLVNQKGFTCIKWFVSSNEPNYRGVKGSSKNYNNTYEKWEQGVKNVRAAFDQYGLQSVGIVGGDVTGRVNEIKEYLIPISKNIKDKVADYGAHLYLSNIDVDRGEIAKQIKGLYDEIKANDDRLGKTIQTNIWEAGLRDGKTVLDCQSLISTPSYAIRMADFTIQSLLSGINGIVYWDFDDAMHFMYSDTAMTPKEWGMFSSLSDASSGKQELRPWYHSTSLLTHLIQKGDEIYSPVENEDGTFRALASRSHDGKRGGFVAVNAGVEPVEKTFKFNEHVRGKKTYVYVFNADSYKLGEDGYIVPNFVLDGSVNSEFTMTIPNSTILVVSNTRL